MRRCCPEWRVSFSDIDLAAVPAEVDSKDRHVAAAALALRRYADDEADAETSYEVILVTDNTADLAEAPMARSGVTVMRPGTFLDLVCDCHPAETEEAVLQAPPSLLDRLRHALGKHVLDAQRKAAKKPRVSHRLNE
jgi:hypothetical protein